MSQAIRIDLLEANTRNTIINGAMDFAQRLPYPNTYTVPAAAANYYVDRFLYAIAGTMRHTVSQAADAPTFAQSGFNGGWSFKVACSTAQPSLASGDYSVVLYRMEGYDFAHLLGRSCLLSFWVKSPVTGTYGLAFRNGAGTRCYVTSYSISVANTWQKVIVPITFNDLSVSWPSEHTQAMNICWSLALGSGAQTSTLNQWQAGNYAGPTTQVNAAATTSSNGFCLAQVMLVATSSAVASLDVPFMRAGRTISDELAMCQRYYEKSWDLATMPQNYTLAANTEIPDNPCHVGQLNNNARMTVPFKVQKRIQPTVTRYGKTSSGYWMCQTANSEGAVIGYSTGLYISPYGQWGMRVSQGITGGLMDYIHGHWTADAEL